MSSFTKMVHYPLKQIGFLVLKYLRKDAYYK